MLGGVCVVAAAAGKNEEVSDFDGVCVCTVAGTTGQEVTKNSGGKGCLLWMENLRSSCPVARVWWSVTLVLRQRHTMGDKK